MEEKPDFKPFVPADRVAPEFTVVSLLLGCLLAVLFGGANAYLGLRVGMTVSASIPAAVISMGIIRVLLRRDSILENNMVQTIGSAGESVAARRDFHPARHVHVDEGVGRQRALPRGNFNDRAVRPACSACSSWCRCARRSSSGSTACSLSRGHRLRRGSARGRTGRLQGGHRLRGAGLGRALQVHSGRAQALPQRGAL